MSESEESDFLRLLTQHLDLHNLNTNSFAAKIVAMNAPADANLKKLTQTTNAWIHQVRNGKKAPTASNLAEWVEALQISHPVQRFRFVALGICERIRSPSERAVLVALVKHYLDLSPREQEGLIADLSTLVDGVIERDGDDL